MPVSPALLQRGNEEYAQRNGTEVKPVPEALGGVAAQPGVSGIDLDAILAEFTPDPTFDVWLPSGDKIVCKSFRTTAEKKKWEQAFGAWYSKLPDAGTPQAYAHRYGSIFPQSPVEASYAHLLHWVAVTPKIPLDTALRFNGAPELMASIMRQIDEGNKAPYLVAMRTVAELRGKAFEETQESDS